MPAGQKNESEREGRSYTSEPAHESPAGAHLWFGLLLITADLQVILQHSAPREKEEKSTKVIAAVACCLLFIRADMVKFVTADSL